MKKGCSVLENAFGILKVTFQELLNKTKMHITLIPDMICACILLRNMLLNEKNVNVEVLMRCLAQEIE